MNQQKEKLGKIIVLTMIYLLPVLLKQKFLTKLIFFFVTTITLPTTGPTLLLL